MPKKKVIKQEPETTEERHQRIAAEARHFIELKEWPEEIAQKLGYASAGNLATKLKAWGYVSLSDRFQKVNFDGLVSPAHRTSYERKRGAAA